MVLRIVVKEAVMSKFGLAYITQVLDGDEPVRKQLLVQYELAVHQLLLVDHVTMRRAMLYIEHLVDYVRANEAEAVERITDSIGHLHKILLSSSNLTDAAALLQQLVDVESKVHVSIVECTQFLGTHSLNDLMKMVILT